MAISGVGVFEMDFTFNDSDKAKYASAKYSLNFIKDGMKIGLGTGSTAAWFVVLLSDFIKKNDIKVTTVATSNFTKTLAKAVGVIVVSLDEIKCLDLTIDGADEFDDHLNLIKGGGGALLQEKIVASASSEMIVIADTGKYVKKLGKFPLPIEVVPFGASSTKNIIDNLFLTCGFKDISGTFRQKNGQIFVTDEGNNIIDYKLNEINNVKELSIKINNITGVIEHGIFTNLCTKVIVGKPSGGIHLFSKQLKTNKFQAIDLSEMKRLNKTILGIKNEI
ncbi:MAG: ribose-5-phosphate isomerase RpiA [Paracoccaceae bacterium]|nr:ribose-5-phosphate isomerase RpiA [Paracoccaceae bacterium]